MELKEMYRKLALYEGVGVIATRYDGTTQNYFYEDFSDSKGIDRAQETFTDLINKGIIKRADYIYNNKDLFEEVGKMLVIKVNFDSDYILTKINGTLEEVAKYYFSNPKVKNIEIIEGGTFQNEYYKRIPTEIYRADEKDIAEFELIYNIRLRYIMDYVDGNTINTSCGLCKVA